MFRFKQFAVQQERSAMKVCTDSCLFGAIVHATAPKRALDIGTGTGLLSLMVAQRYPDLSIDAVEVDSGAAADASENFAQSPFKNQLQLHQCRIQDWANTTSYDLIFSNPPFYENQLKSPLQHKNIAHHGTDLSFRELAAIAAERLLPNGVFWILLPPASMNAFLTEANRYALHCQERYLVRHKEEKPIFREIAAFAFPTNDSPKIHEVVIYENDQYSRIFASLLSDYYLIF